MAKKTVWLPYDFDTAIGINNEGALAFSYDLEDTDVLEGADVYNGQDSILWNNVRDAYGEELKAMYQNLRSTGALSYEKVEQMFEDHQNKWPEVIFNEDAQFKYIDPLIDDGDAAYLSMLQGSKEEQRKWWLWNRFRYLDSKYNAGDALTQVITLRGYAKDDITITPYASIYASIKYGSYLVQDRAERNVAVTLECPLDNVNDTEIYIYSADQIADVGDISGLKVGYANFSYATKLVNLKIGDSSANYSNPNLGAHQTPALALGNNTLLKTLDVRNCPNLTETVDLSGCTNIEEVYFDGTSITGVNLPNGGVLNTLHLPDTITYLTIQNQPNLTDFVLNDSSNISTLVLENAGSAIDSYEIFANMQAGGRVRIIGFDWTVENGDNLITLLSSMRGIDANGNTTEIPQLKGTITITGTDTLQSSITSIIGTCPDVTMNYTAYKTDDLYKFLNTDTLNLILPDATYISRRAGLSAQYNSSLWFPNLSSGGISAGFVGATNGAIYVGVGKQGDTEVVPLKINTSAMFGNSSSKIYVPDALVEDYKVATNWASVAGRIYPLSEATYEGWNGGVY